MRNYKKIAGSGLGMILLALLSSAIYDIFAKSFFYKFRDLGLNIITLGITKLSDSIFLEIARGYHESASMEMLAFVYGFILSLPLFILLSTGFSKHYIKMFAKSLKTAMLNEQEESKKGFKITRYLFLLYIIFFLSFSFFQFYKTNYINKSITYYKQLHGAVAPYLEKNESLIIESMFAQIKSKSEYDDIINRLQNKAYENKTNIASIKNK